MEQNKNNSFTLTGHFSQRLKNPRLKWRSFNCGAALTQLPSAAGSHPSMTSDRCEVASPSPEFCCHPSDHQGTEAKTVEAKKSLIKRAQRTIGKVWLEHRPVPLANGNELTLVHQLGTRRITTEEEETAQHFLNEISIDVDTTIAMVSGPWDKRLNELGAACFLFAPEGPTPKEKGDLLKMLTQVRKALHKPIRIKLSDYLSEGLIGYVNFGPVSKRPNGKIWLSQMEGLPIAKGEVHLSRERFKKSPGMEAAVLHEVSHREANTTDVRSLGQDDEQATSGYIDYPFLHLAQEIRFRKGRTPEKHLAKVNADAFTYFIRALVDKEKVSSISTKPEPDPAKPTPAVPTATTTLAPTKPPPTKTDSRAVARPLPLNSRSGRSG